MIRDILIPAIVTLIVILIVTNITSILIHWHIVKSDIEDIHDKNLKVELLQSLKDKHKIFFRRILYHKDSDYFSSEEDYNKYMVYMNIGSIEYDCKYLLYNKERKVKDSEVIIIED